RAWEMVSQPDKKGSALETQMTNLGSAMQAAVNGDAVTYVANGPTEEEPQGNRSPEPQQLFSTRTVAGWATKNITTPIEKVGGLSLGVGEEYKLFSDDLSVAALSTTVEGKLKPTHFFDGRRY